MLCVYKGTVCYLKYSVISRRWCYIRQRKWDTMSNEERMLYVDSQAEAYAMEDCD